MKTKVKKMEEDKIEVMEFFDRIGRIIDGVKANLKYSREHKLRGEFNEKFYAGQLDAYRNIKSIAKELKTIV